MAKLLLNAVSIGTDPAAKFVVGSQEYSREALERFRREYAEDYFFKRGGEDGAFIHSIPLKAGLSPIGTGTEEHLALEAPWLVRPLALDALLRFFNAFGRPIEKA